MNEAKDRSAGFNALQTAWYGVKLITIGAKITHDPNLTIRDKTKQAINDLNTKYKEAGGGNEFDDISQYYDHE